MPEKIKQDENTIFSQEVIEEANRILLLHIPEKHSKPNYERLKVSVSDNEEWSHDNESEFFADYNKGFVYAVYSKSYGYYNGRIEIIVHNKNTEVSIKLPKRDKVEDVFNIFEKNVEKCRLPKEPKKVTKAETDWVNETVKKVYNYCPTAGRKIKSVLIKLESEDKEEWQSACMLVRDAWIELSDRLCKINMVDISNINKDAVVDKLRAIGLHKIDDKLSNLARGSFNLAFKHHNREISHFDTIACVVSSIVSMKTIIEEALNARSES